MIAPCLLPQSQQKNNGKKEKKNTSMWDNQCHKPTISGWSIPPIYDDRMDGNGLYNWATLPHGYGSKAR
jgi:hypothetical protein